MKQQSEERILVYTDTEALAFGVLISAFGSPVNRIERTVFDHFIGTFGHSEASGPIVDVAPLRRAMKAILARKPALNGWRRATYQGKKLWLVPNDVEGLTLMFAKKF